MKTLKAGDRIRVAGVRWSNQSIGTIKAFNARYGAGPHDFGDYAWVSADAVVIDGRKPEPRIEIEQLELFVIEGYGTYYIEAPGFSTGDSCVLKPVELNEGVTTQEKADKARVEKIGYPQYDNT